MASSKFEPKAGELLRHLLRRRRWELGLTQRDVAALAMLNVTSVRNYETRKHDYLPRDASLERLSAALDVPWQYMLLARSRQWRPRIPTQPASAPCGTRGAYRRHRRRGEAPCAACNAAQSAYNARMYLGIHRIYLPSPYIGVGGIKGKTKITWIASVQRKEGNQYLIWRRYFDDEHEAARARDAMALEHQGAMARLNFPREKAA